MATKPSKTSTDPSRKCDVFRWRECHNPATTTVEMKTGRRGSNWNPIPSCEQCASDAVKARPGLYRLVKYYGTGTDAASISEDVRR